MVNRHDAIAASDDTKTLEKCDTQNTTSIIEKA